MSYANGGVFVANTVTGNDGWAGVSIIDASSWTISRNNVVQAPVGSANGPGFDHPYRACRYPGNSRHPAAVFLCQTDDLNGHVTTHNIIQGNRLSGPYGILLSGLQGSGFQAPRFNVIIDNNVSGSGFGCADDLAPRDCLTRHNTYRGNNCSGRTNTNPIYY